MRRKYDAEMKVAIDVFWRQNKYPPTLRDLMHIVGISSTSVCRCVIRRLDGVRIAKNGRVIPLWVDNLFSPTPLALDGAIAPDNQQVLPADVLVGEGTLPEPPRQ